MARNNQQFTTIRTEGAILPPDILQRIVSQKVNGMRPADYHLPEGFKTTEAITQSWDMLKKHWKSFQEAKEQLADTDTGTSMTNERWLLPLFRELDYGRLTTETAPVIEERTYPIERFYNNTPIHLIGWNLTLDRRTKGARGAATSSPHSMVQEYLNRSEAHLWAFVSNGRQLRLLRDNVALSRQAYVEFDLEAMMEGEVYSDFALLWMLCHQSRVEAEKTEDCWLEKWSKLAREEGTRVLNNLRTGVADAIEALGHGFLADPRNDELRRKLQESGSLSKDDFYRQLLRIVYRLLFLFVAEDRELLHPPVADDANDETKEQHRKATDLYRKYYSTSRLRDMSLKLRGSKHGDLWHSLSLVFADLGNNEGCPQLGLVGLGSFLWNTKSVADLAGPHEVTGDAVPVHIANDDLLTAIRALAYVEQDRVLRSVDYRNLGSEELGSVYESLLELNPDIEIEARYFELRTAAGNERKTSGSYYTPDSLVQCLLDSALDPVVDERLKGKKGEAAENAILTMTVCDPACGSGHFLIAAAHRLARHLARVRTGDSEPSPEDHQHALRDVIGRCIYGVDINPMAVELCKVSLWIEAIEPGKPLSFLEHHIRCGNSLLGTTPELLADGIPDDAFKPIGGDVKANISDLKKQNKSERKDLKSGQRHLFEPFINLGNLPNEFNRLSRTSDNSIADVAEKEQFYAQLVDGADYQNARLLADTWCAVFVWSKDSSDLGKLCPTERDFRKIESNPHNVLPQVKCEVRRLADQYQFFHWHLAFPDVFPLPDPDEQPENEQMGWNAGFDVVLGNPPWDMQEVKDNEFFATSYPDMLSVKSAKDKKAVLATIQADAPQLWNSYVEYVRLTHGQKHFLLHSERYPLSGQGRLNLYRVFLETDHTISSQRGRVGVVVPSGFASDSFCQPHFKALHTRGRIASLFDFENRYAIFPGVHKSFKFCLLTITGQASPRAESDFVFFASDASQLADRSKHIRIGRDSLQLFNPNTGTCPVFRSKKDAEVTRAIYQRVPILDHDVEGSPWSAKIVLMFMINAQMTSHRDREQLESEGATLDGNVFHIHSRRWLPMYEGKMLGMCDHRSASVVFNPENAARRNVQESITVEQKGDPHHFTQPLHWIREDEVVARTGTPIPNWMLVFKSITATTNQRTFIATIIPLAAANDKVPWLRSAGSAIEQSCLLACLNSHAFDFVVRQKIAGVDLRAHYVKQFPVLPPAEYEGRGFCGLIAKWIAARVLELTCTAWDLEPFAKDCGYDGPPFRWNDERRFLLRCELDAAYFHLYLGTPSEWGNGSTQVREMFSTPRDAVDYMMGTFPIVKKRDIKRTAVLDHAGEVVQEGTYITKDTILSIYDDMQHAIDSGQPYQTRLDPPPGPPLDVGGNVVPFGQWDEANWPSNIHRP